MAPRTKRLMKSTVIASCLLLAVCQGTPLSRAAQPKLSATVSENSTVRSAGVKRPPYPRSRVIGEIAWHWDTYATAAPGRDLWPIAWGCDDCLYCAWGDGGGFGGTDSERRVAMGFGRIEGSPERFLGVNVNGGKNSEHPASFSRKGKTAGIVFVDGALFATVNLQDRPWPDVDHVLAWSEDRGATWTRASWVFPKGPGNFQPAKFLQFGKD
jgi:hypothetical protein